MYALIKSAGSLLLLATLLTACSSPTLKDEPSGEFADQGLHEVRNSGFEWAWARPQANLPAYRVLDIVDMDLAGTEFSRAMPSGTVRAQWQTSPRLERDLQQLWRDITGRVFSDYDLSADGDRVLRVKAALTRVAAWRTSSTSNTAPGRSGGVSAESVRVTAEFTLYDVASGDLLAVIRDQRVIGLKEWTRGAGQGLNSSFNSWAALLHTRISGR